MLFGYEFEGFNDINTSKMTYVTVLRRSGRNGRTRSGADRNSARQRLLLYFVE